MDLITLANDIINAATHIDAGRKGFATKGKALLKQRFANLFAGQGGYVDLQRKALGNNK